MLMMIQIHMQKCKKLYINLGVEAEDIITLDTPKDTKRKN